MKKRTFIKVSSIAAAGSLILPLSSCTSETKPKVAGAEGLTKPTIFELPKLTYGFDALAPNIDARTMEIHHGKHHAGYVRKLNTALEGQKKFVGKSLEEILMSVGTDDIAIRNNGGGHYNHSLYWNIMSPKSSSPQGDMLDALNTAFGSFEKFKSQFAAAATNRFGSGWAWLSVDERMQPLITSTPNQDNPLMKGILGTSHRPLFGIDVWEHAYYLNYQNRRGDYVNNFFNVINWDVVTDRFKEFAKG